ncbi:hypothetical protein QWY86_00195 [Pedobacter aquatilis]|uniref:hypothetical protein n=1 Tax=Pedobacter aquatilis TaxID=351343 RepID=UPI0025B431E8|nr:hypothetical protein [Pedobacter aquatilis]MDN3585074.1 hypothetical protein [Pedobacter aquatilis]
MKKIYLLFFLSFFTLLSVSAKVIVPVICNTIKSLPKEDLEKEKIETSSEEKKETGSLKTTEFILNQSRCVIFLKRIKISFSNYNIVLPIIYSIVPKQPPKAVYFFE